jgi:hypothetical protein
VSGFSSRAFDWHSWRCLLYCRIKRAATCRNGTRNPTYATTLFAACDLAERSSTLLPRQVTLPQHSIPSAMT